MRRYRVTGVLEAPLVVRRERQSQRSEGVRYVSGTLLRGALAQAYLQEAGQPDDTFARLFLDETQCRFGPLDPGEQVFPRTAYSCKRESGFKGADSKHGVIDILADLLACRCHGRPPVQRDCPKCQNHLKPLDGFWEYREGQPVLASRRWRRSSATHVGIDRTTYTAAEGMLFSLPIVEPEPAEQEPAALVGWIDATDETAEVLRRLLASCDGIVRIGHARTRGYGRVRLRLNALQPSAVSEGATPPTSRLQSWLDFSQRMLSLLDMPQLTPDEHFLFTLTLPCGAVLVDQVLRYTLDPSGMVPWLPPLPRPDPTLRAADHPAVELGGGRLQCVTAVAQHERLRGWNVAHGLPRQDEWAVSRGAVYAYMYTGGAEGLDELARRLAELENMGLGARRNEGFGTVVICDEFHLHFAPEQKA